MIDIPLVALAEDLLAQPDLSGDVARLRGLKLRSSKAYSALGAAALDHLGEFAALAPALNGLLRDPEPGGDFLVGALQAGQLLQLGQVDAGLRAPLLPAGGVSPWLWH